MDVLTLSVIPLCLKYTAPLTLDHEKESHLVALMSLVLSGKLRFFKYIMRTQTTPSNFLQAAGDGERTPMKTNCWIRVNRDGDKS